ncbi:MAG: hypothetical protein JXM79_24185 [Sedimentisphaerales bacterium]|nr:hypothetical protein [Sedimentisphaerales bacterium]
MIEQALRKRLQPTVNRRRRLYLALWLSACWFVSLIVGIGLICVYWLWGWTSSAANWALCISTVLASLLILHKSHQLRVDYKAVARDIEHKHPDLKALLLTAIEQKPDKPGGSLNYLQERVIGEAVRHAVRYDWLRSVSSTRLVLAQIAWILALTLLIGAMSQLLLPRPFLLRTGGNMLAQRGYQITVTPGDTDVESGTPVVVLARFEGRVPQEVILVFESSDEEPQQITLTKNLEDPVFGGIIPQVNHNLLYRIEYADRSTRDYHINVYEHPTLTRADAKIVYPAYTKLPEKTIQDTRRVSAIEGSQITLTFTLNKAVATAQLVPKEGPALNLTVDGEHPNVYTTAITATDNRRYELNLVDGQGLKNEIPQRFTIDVHKNLPPEIKPVFPNRDVLASPLEELSLEAEISDDYGITHYGMSYALAGVQSADITLSPLENSQQKQNFQHLLALEDLGAQPDQLLTYYFWADDIGPNGKNRRTSSDMYFTEVRHFEEIFRESESFQNQDQQNQNQQGQQQDQQGGQLAELQKQIISATWNIKRQADLSGSLNDQKEDLDVVRQSQADVLEQAQSTLTQTQEPSAIKALQTATKHMETSLDHLVEAGSSSTTSELTPALAAEQSAYQELLKLRDREHQVTQSRSANASSRPRSARSERQLQQLELRQRENRYESERLAQSQEQTTQREDLQVQNRLRDLARRQSEMTDKLKETETALRQAQNEREREEINRELRRLRDEQLEALRDVDELQERMERRENRQRMADTRQQLDQSRSRIRQSAEELERGMVSRAITSTTRAQRELEQMRDQFRRNTSSQFSEQMRQMREQAQQLDEHQKDIANEMLGQQGSEQKTLRDSSDTQNLADRMDQQKESMEDLIEQMKDVSEQSETSEPLLSRKLYETVRETSTKNIDRDLEVAGELIRRNFLPQAQEIEKRAGQGIEELRKGVEEAADSVLGDEAEALRLAREQLDELIREVNEEVARANASGQKDGDPNGPERQTSNQQPRADAQRGIGRGQESDPNRPGNMQANQQQVNTQRGTAQGQGGDPNRPRDADQRVVGVSPANQGRLALDTRGWGGNQGAFGPWEQVDPNGPLTGRDFRQWSDRLRDVEEMLNESEMRAEAARVRDRARAIRAEFTRHGKEPQWDMVRQMITKPLTELRDRISEELSSLESVEAMVPIDRDPVPGRFADLVRRYYENLGGEK